MANVFHGAVAVHGFRELQLLFSKTDKESRAAVREIEREIAEPVQVSAESLALTRISHIDKKWWRMRIGITRNFIYVAPKQRGVKTRGPHPRKRPRFADLLAEKAMEPSAERYAPEFPRRVEAAFNEIARRWGQL